MSVETVEEPLVGLRRCVGNGDLVGLDDVAVEFDAFRAICHTCMAAHLARGGDRAADHDAALKASEPPEPPEIATGI